MRPYTILSCLTSPRWASRQAIRFCICFFGGFASASSLFACSGGGGQSECDVSGGVTHQPVEPGEGVFKAGILARRVPTGAKQAGTLHMPVAGPWPYRAQHHQLIITRS
jgi:hypothetical protein